MRADGDPPPQHFIHTQASHFTTIFFFYAYGNTPPTDLLQHIPHDAPRADILSLGCSDLRDLLYSILLHGRRGVGCCGRAPRRLSFCTNDWEPAIHARSLMFLQLILDSRHLLDLDDRPAAGASADDLAREMDGLAVGGGGGGAGASVPPSSSSSSGGKGPPSQKKAPKHKAAAAAQETQSEATAAAAGAGAEAKPSPRGGGANAAFAQRIGVVFCAMYNMFVDADALEMIYDVAGRLAASAASPAAWASSELGRIVQFADDRSMDRVRKILSLYTDGSLQDKGVFRKIREERTAFLATYLKEEKKPSIISRAMGLGSLRQLESLEPSAKMRRHYLREGVLDPYPLLLDEETPAKDEGKGKDKGKDKAKGNGKDNGKGKGRGPFRKVNPLLLVTERKGSAPSLHYGAFPLDAFHTDVSWWKLQPPDRQEEFGKLAPAVTKPLGVASDDPRGGHNLVGEKKISNETRQNMWFAAALEELAQMCGAFLAATTGTAGTPAAAAAPHLSITIQVGDVLNFCDALLSASSPSAGSSSAEGGVAGSGCGSPGAVFGPLSFQQGSLQPLHLRADVFSCPPEFDVISTSNMAEHLGIINLLVATAPLLKTLPHAVLLTSLMASLVNLHRYKNTAEFQEKLLCMSPHVAGILLGVVPASSLSSVVGHVDTMSLLAASMGSMFSRPQGASESAPSQLRLAWKRPTAAFAETAPAEGSAPGLVDISPSELVGLMLPIYQKMVPLAGAVNLSKDEWTAVLTTANHYTSASFCRILALAARRLRLGQAHFRAVLNALMYDSGMLMDSNMSHEQMGLFHVLGLAPLRANDFGPRPMPTDARRIVLLVPKVGLDLLREFTLPGVYMSCTATTGARMPFDNHFTSVHLAYVRVHRGGSRNGGDVDLTDGRWRSLNSHVSVRDARADDPQAELMVSALVPTLTFILKDPRTELQLRPRESLELHSASKGVVKRLGGQLATKVFYKALLSDADRTAVLTPGDEQPGASSGRVAGLPPPLAVPTEVAKGAPAVHDPSSSGSSSPQGRDRRSGGPDPDAAVLHRSGHGNSAVDRSVELLNQAAKGRAARLAYRVTLVMANGHALGILAAAEGAPEVTKMRDPCAVRVELGEGLQVTTHLPFPAARPSAMHIKMSRRQGYVHLTVPLLRGALPVPFSLTTYGAEGGARRRRTLTLPSTVFWPPCAPLASLPRLDLKSEWACSKVMGLLSFTHAERSMRDKASTEFTSADRSLRDKASAEMKSVVNPALLGVKESMLAIATMATEHHDEDRPVWPHPWVCISEDHNTPGPAIWVWVNEILLDSTNESVVLDCCVMPVENLRDDAASAQLMESIEIQYGSRKMTVKAYPGELDLWAALLAVAVERARQSYTHTADCLYAKTSDAGLTLCNCGKGKDLPPFFMHSVELANAMGRRVPVHPQVYRAALPPLYSPPDTCDFVGKAKAATAAAAAGGGGGGGGGSSGSKCAKCGKTGKSLLCTRCKKVSYCSKECQVSHWKTHKPACRR